MASNLGAEVLPRVPSAGLLVRAEYWEGEATRLEAEASVIEANPNLTILQRERAGADRRYVASQARLRAKSERRAWVDRVLGEAGELIARLDVWESEARGLDGTTPEATEVRSALIDVQAYVMGRI